MTEPGAAARTRVTHACHTETGSAGPCAPSSRGRSEEPPPCRAPQPSPGPSPHLAIGAGRGKSVPVGREPHAVDEAAVVLRESRQSPPGHRWLRQVLREVPACCGSCCSSVDCRGTGRPRSSASPRRLPAQLGGRSARKALRPQLSRPPLLWSPQAWPRPHTAGARGELLRSYGHSSTAMTFTSNKNPSGK